MDQAVWSALQPKTSSSSPLANSSEVESEIALWNNEIDPNATDSNLPQAVRSLTINIAQICNLKCTYCAADGDGTYGDPVKKIDLDKTYDQIRMLLHDVPAGESFNIMFLGGEPLVAPEAIRSIARFAKLQVVGRDIRLGFSIVTNGTLITPEIAELLASINCHVTISLDGPPEINDRNRVTRGGTGSSDRVMKGIENLQKVRNRLHSLNVGAVFGSHNTDVLSAYKYFEQFNFDTVKIDFAAEENDQDISRAYTEAVLATADYAFKKGGEKELRKIHIFDAYFRILDNQSRIHNHCGAGKSHLQIDSRGRFYTCQWFVNDKDEQVGDGLKIDFEKLKAYESPLTELNSCGDCWARHLCGGGCMFVHKLKTGSKHKTDNEYCVRTRSLIAKGIEHYAEARQQTSEGDRCEVY